MTNPIRSAVVALLLACAIVAPIASAWGNGAMSKPARFPAAPVAVSVEPMTITSSVTLPETVVEGRAPARRAVRRAVVIVASSELCRVRGLDQGGRPGAETVLSCE